MRRMLPANRIVIKRPCTCHDPTVFGHLTCRSETQPNNTPPRPPDTSYVTRINASSITTEILTCAIEDGVVSMDQLNTAMLETTQRVTDLTDLIRYIDRRYGNPPPHG